MKNHYIIGLMSGSSLDGLDIAYCQFTFDENPKKGQIRWQILDATTIGYPLEWQDRLRKTTSMSSIDLLQTDAELGQWMGLQVKAFIDERNINVDFVASHGHTVFHFPERGFSLQIGNGNHLSEKCGLPVIYDFRTADIAAGGQGAPFAPVVDEWLFGEYDFFLNLGGIANIAGRTKDGFVGYDVVGANQMLNALAEKLDHTYDKGGRIAATGSINHKLMMQLSTIDFFTQNPPKSLDNQWVRVNMTAPILAFNDTVANKLATTVEFVAQEISKEINTLATHSEISKPKLLVTGGGAHNSFLMERIKSYCSDKIEIIIPDTELINNKESLLIALLGLLNKYQIPNSSPHVTGANRNTIGGITTE